MRFAGEVAVVTGASGGIGQAIALHFAEEGAKVAVVDTAVEKLEQLAETVRARGGESIAIRADVSRSNDVSEMVSAIKETYGRMDILLNVAGVYARSAIENTSEEEWDRIVDINLKGTFLCSQSVGRAMIEQRRGKIVNIASIAGECPRVYLGAYSSSKAGVILLTKVMALEWAKYNITVNAISPGIVATPSAINAFESEQALTARTRTVPLKRMGEPADIARAALFLASADADYISGCVLPVDGASSISMYYLMSDLISQYTKHANVEAVCGEREGADVGRVDAE